MIEKLGPSMARTLVGDAYSPDFSYELETDGDGLHLIVTSKETGESSSVFLEDTVTDRPEIPEPLYSEERIAQLQPEPWWRQRASDIAFMLCILAIIVGGTGIVLYFIK